jgi:hypothetical protein
VVGGDCSKSRQFLLKTNFDRSFTLSRVTPRSEATMAINFIQNTITAANFIGQGIVVVAGGWQSLALRAASISEAIESCGLYMASGSWCALSLKRMPATATPATCRTNDRRHQRHQRWMTGVVVVDPGTVGVG